MSANPLTGGAQGCSNKILHQQSNKLPALRPSSRNNSCPVCNGSDGSCGIEPDAVFCNHCPRNGRYLGDRLKDRDGQRWKFISRDDQGRALFVRHRFRDHTPRNLEDVRGNLQEAMAEGVGPSELQQLVAQLAQQTDQPLLVVQRIAEAIHAEDLHTAEVAVEAEALAAQASRQVVGQQLTARFLLPATLAAAIETRTRYLPTDGPSAVLPFLVAVAGLVKLGTQVEASAVAGYRVPINLFGCLVGRSGAKKSPVGRLLLEMPLADLKAEQRAENERERQAWADACRDLKKGDPKPALPLPKRLVVSDYTGEALA